MNTPPRILLIEDEKVQRMLLSHRLEEAGYHVEEAVDGPQGLEVVSEVRPDLILLDCIMPGMDGFEVLARLRRDPEFRSIPVLMLTTLQGTQDKARGLEVGADDFLVKPVEGLEFLARVRSLLRLKELRDDLEARNRLLRRILTRYLAPDLVQRLLEDPDEASFQLGGRMARVSVLFADVRGFTGFAERNPPGQVAAALNDIFDVLVPIIFENHGTFDKYLGDAVLAFFGAPTSYPDDALRAVRTARQMQEAFEVLLESRPDLAELGLGIAVATGDALVGNLGSHLVADYTVIGDIPNVARRLQERSRGGQILVCSNTARDVGKHVDLVPLEPVQLRGKSEAIENFQVTGLR